MKSFTEQTKLFLAGIDDLYIAFEGKPPSPSEITLLYKKGTRGQGENKGQMQSQEEDTHSSTFIRTARRKCPFPTVHIFLSTPYAQPLGLTVGPTSAQKGGGTQQCATLQPRSAQLLERGGHLIWGTGRKQGKMSEEEELSE